eukprot:CAMPEP_0172062160 /NCGR_PEP_ID=MMETSP1043-20130122/8881_1 /TAXON_ID=464988 /ORGANISM="Hemiselmis andersenii, Strain CCMP441" /LENGTH=124 /DNA_ID=CAMNT_0012722037 /DNA_START=177 /DNA_END=548 /DNA_ORIENTATION=+
MLSSPGSRWGGHLPLSLLLTALATCHAFLLSPRFPLAKPPASNPPLTSSASLLGPRSSFLGREEDGADLGRLLGQCSLSSHFLPEGLSRAAGSVPGFQRNKNTGCGLLATGMQYRGEGGGGGRR